MWKNVAGKTFLREIEFGLGATDWAVAVSGCALDMKMGTVLLSTFSFKERKKNEAYL